MNLDVEALRADTPGVDHVVHLNNAGASLAPRPVLDTVVDHLRREAEIGGYEAAAEADERLEAVYDAVARLVGGERDEVALIENATRAWGMAFYSLPLAPGDRILTATTEYASNFIAFLQARRTRGVEVEIVPAGPDGSLDLGALETALRDPVALVAINHVPTANGVIEPAAEVGRLARAAGVPFLLDACQSIGQMPVDVHEIGCDFLSATGRKYLRGPRGTGFLWVRREWVPRLEPVMLDLRAATWVGRDEYEVRQDARRFENWESHVGGRLGLGVAVRYAIGVGLAAIAERVQHLAESLREGLAGVPGVEVRDTGRERSGIVTFTHPLGAGTIRRRLAEAAPRINVDTSTVRSQRIDFAGRGLEEVVRASVHYFNTGEEVDRLVAEMAASGG